jgi:glycosyltransferase involved in cell wall biosynthesis
MISRPSTPLAVVVLTYNEARNLAACLASVTGWVDELFVVDSGSTDRTVAIAEQHGASVVRHPFESHAKQWNWALQRLPITAAWVLGLDADQRVTPELRDELLQLMGDRDALHDGAVGYYIKRKQIFRGVWIKHGGYYPKYLLKLFHRDAVWVDESEYVDHHFRVRGGIAKLHHNLIEDNRNEADISVWVAKHDRYATLQAQEEASKPRHDGQGSHQGALLHSPDNRVLWRKLVWSRMPLYVRPLFYFVYRYICRLGFLDGKQGFIFHFLHAFWYRLLIDIKLDELRQQQAQATGRQAVNLCDRSASDD